MALLHPKDKIYTVLDYNRITIGIFLDLLKAFDTVDHKILISKLHRYGFQDVVGSMTTLIIKINMYI